MAYYAWYVLKRQSNINNGWIDNPQHNKPDFSVLKEEMVKCFDRWGVHSKTTTQIDQKGVMVSTLTNNRSKANNTISDFFKHYDIPENIFKPYLIESSEKQNSKGVFSFRLNLAADKIYFL